jgi:hypothetical protein
MSKIIFALTVIALINVTLSTVCRDGSQCPGTTTCCLTSSGVGCCPFENANCCGDGLHCCPNGYNCDVSGGRCVQSGSNKFLTFVETSPAKYSPPIVTGPSISDIIKCVSDLKPFITEVIDLVKIIKTKDTSGLKDLLIKLAHDGYDLGVDCYKVIKS